MASYEREEGGFSFGKLTRKNYSSWMAIVKAEMLLKGCYQAVLGYPELAEGETLTAEKKERATHNLQAYSVIIRTISEDLISDVILFDDAKLA